MGYKKRTMHHKIIIIGSGPAGLTAAIYAARANLEPFCIEGTQPGGQLTITTDVENFPGFPDGVQGPELMNLFRKQAEKFGTKFITTDVTKTDLSAHPFSLEMGEESHSAQCIIIATGASAKTLGLPKEKDFLGHGLSMCATCDGFFFQKQKVVIVGGGDTALEEAIFLTRFASEVAIVHRRDQLRGSKILQDRAFNNKKIKFIWDSVVTEILGKEGEKVTGVRLKNKKTGKESDHKCSGLFVAIGHQPNTDLFTGQLEMNEVGYIITKPDTTMTSVEGVFACGDVQDHVYRQAVTAAGSGCMAAIEAERWLETQ